MHNITTTISHEQMYAILDGVYLTRNTATLKHTSTTLNGVKRAERPSLTRVSVVAWRRIAQQLIDLLHVLVRQTLCHRQTSKVLHQLLWLGGTQQHSGYIFVLDTPCQCKLAYRALEGIRSESSESTNLFDLPIGMPLIQLLD